MDAIVQMDSKGRILIPSEFRENLDLESGDSLLLSLDSRRNILFISPVYGSKNLVKIEIEFNDKIGALAEIADSLSKMKIDLIMTESKSFQRWKKARWIVIADASNCKLTDSKIKNQLSKLKFVNSILIERIERGLVHSL